MYIKKMMMRKDVFEFKKLRKLKLLLFFGGLMNTKKQQRKTF